MIKQIGTVMKTEDAVRGILRSATRIVKQVMRLSDSFFFVCSFSFNYLSVLAKNDAAELPLSIAG